MRFFRKKPKDYRAMDDLTIGQLRAHDLDVSRPSRVEHFLYVKQQKDAEAIGAGLRQKSFSVDVHPSPDGSAQWSVIATHDMLITIESITATRAMLTDVAESVGGEYDGWGTAGPPDE